MPYIGKSPTGTGVRSRYYFTATGGETSLSGADDNSNTLVFSDGNYVDVSLNGIALVAGTDYNTSTANTIAGLSALSASDIVEIVVYDIFTVADTVSAKDGGTFSGNVAMGGTLSVTGTSTLTGAATATGGLNVGTIKEATGTTTAMTIDSSGRILMPTRPAFNASVPSNISANLSSETLINFTSESFDVGGNYDNTSGQSKFVAPVTGLYSFSANVRIDGLGSAYGYIRFYKNGSAIAVGALNITSGHGTSFHTFQIHDLFELTSGDYIQVFGATPGDTTTTVYAEQTVFSGFLIG